MIVILAIFTGKKSLKMVVRFFHIRKLLIPWQLQKSRNTTDCRFGQRFPKITGLSEQVLQQDTNIQHFYSRLMTH